MFMYGADSGFIPGGAIPCCLRRCFDFISPNDPGVTDIIHRQLQIRLIFSESE
jgi:hypothetical protein